MSNHASKTEAPTSKKLQQARDKGNVPRTTELSGAFTMGAFLIFFKLFGADWLREARAMMAGGMSEMLLVDATPSQWTTMLQTVAVISGKLMVLPVGAMAVAGLAGGLVQGSPPWTLKPLTPDFTKLNPFTGIKKLFRLKALIDLSKASIKVVLFSLIAWSAVRRVMDEGMPGAPGAEGTLASLVELGGAVFARIVFLMLALALLDLLYTRWDHTRGLKMTKQEVKEEHKQLEGDPRIKSKIRQKQYEIARARMMADVPQATVVVTNPTHYAIALRYVPGEMSVPKVLAKGRAVMARRIREVAIQHNIPIIQDPLLARALYKAVPVGGFVPEALFHAVAEVLALVLRRRPGGRRGPGTRRPDPLRPTP